MATRAYRAEMGEPPMPDEGAPGPMTKKQRLGKMVIGKSSDVTPEERKKIMRDMTMASDPVPGEKKFAKGGSASSRADGCAKRGKTRGTMV